MCVGVRLLLCAWRSDAHGGCSSYAAACLYRVPNSSLQHGQRSEARRDCASRELWHARRAPTDVWRALVRVLLWAWRFDACGATLTAAAGSTPPPIFIECQAALSSTASAAGRAGITPGASCGLPAVLPLTCGALSCVWACVCCCVRGASALAAAAASTPPPVSLECLTALSSTASAAGRAGIAPGASCGTPAMLPLTCCALSCVWACVCCCVRGSSMLAAAADRTPPPVSLWSGKQLSPALPALRAAASHAAAWLFVLPTVCLVCELHRPVLFSLSQHTHIALLSMLVEYSAG